MADWDDDSFEPTGLDDKPNTDKWEGEDEDDEGVKDNWDDDDDEDGEKKKEESEVTKAQPVKKKKTLKEAIKEKEAKKEEERKMKAELKKQMEEESKPMTKEEILAEKLRQQKLVEDSDLLLAMDTFGTSKQEEENTEGKGLDAMKPSSKDEFTEYSKLLVEKLSQFESSALYVQFLEDTLRDLCASLEADDIKKLSHCLNLLHSEKLKAQKGKLKGKNKPKKAGLQGGKAGKKDDMNYDGLGAEFDDFI